MNIRTITLSDYPNLITFWKEHYVVSEMDEIEHFRLFLQKNPELSVLAEENDNIIGTTLGSYDGRRGYIQKVVTDTSKRRNGIGKLLVEEVCHRLKKAGALYIPISVEPTYIHFYETCGFVKKDASSMSRDL